MTTLLTTQEAIFDISAAQTDGISRAAAFSATVSDYSTAYVALVGANHIHCVSKKAGTVTVTVSGHSQDGTALPPITKDFTFNTPPSPQADHFITTDPSVRNTDTITPQDPGTDTVTGTV